MKNFDTIEEAKSFFANDKFATENGISVEALNEKCAVAVMTVLPRHKNAVGGVMGGAIFTLADFAFAMLTNDRNRTTVAQQVSINYLAPAREGRLTATASYIKDGRSSCVVNVDIEDDSGRQIARFTGTGFKLKQ